MLPEIESETTVCLNLGKIFKNQLATVNSRLIEFREKQKWA